MKIPGYKLGRVVETGKACVVYNALDIKRSKTVVVKIYNETFSENKRFQSHFKRVTSVLFNRSLGNNFRLLDAIPTDKNCVLVTNYIPNLVRADLRPAKYAKEEFIRIARQLAVSLSQLHDLDIVHGGVELSNLYFSEVGDIVLGTPALHRTMPGNNTSNFALQNIQEVASLAPEAKRGLTAGTDFYSLGVLLYELLTGRKPFDINSITRLEQQKKTGEYLPLGKEYSDLKPLFDSLLSPDQNFRIASEKDFDSMLKVYRIFYQDSDSHLLGENSVTEPELEEEQQTSSDVMSFVKRPMVMAIAASMVIFIMAVIIMFSENKQASTAGQTLNIEQPHLEQVIKEPVVERQVEEDKEVNGFYANANALFAAGEFEAALLAVDDALRTGFDQQMGQDLKARIELEIEVQSFLVMAEQQFEDDKVIMPPGDNAFETYQRIANITPTSDERASKGMDKLANHFLVLANQQVNNKSRDAARKSIIQGLMVSPNDAALLELDAWLKKQGQIKNKDLSPNDATQSNTESFPAGQRIHRIDAAYRPATDNNNGLINRQ